MMSVVPYIGTLHYARSKTHLSNLHKYKISHITLTTKMNLTIPCMLKSIKPFRLQRTSYQIDMYMSEEICICAYIHIFEKYLFFEQSDNYYEEVRILTRNFVHTPQMWKFSQLHP